MSLPPEFRFPYDLITKLVAYAASSERAPTEALRFGKLLGFRDTWTAWQHDVIGNLPNVGRSNYDEEKPWLGLDKHQVPGRPRKFDTGRRLSPTERKARDAFQIILQEID